MGDAESGAAGRPSLERSMSKRGSFAAQFRGGFATLPFDQALQIYHGTCLLACVAVAVLLAIFGNNTSVLFAIVVLLGAGFFGCVLAPASSLAPGAHAHAAAQLCMRTCASAVYQPRFKHTRGVAQVSFDQPTRSRRAVRKPGGGAAEVRFEVSGGWLPAY